MPRFIDIDGGTPIAAAGDARAAISAERLNTFNVLEYGAIGDGTTDDTAAIQSAIDAAVTAGGGKVLLDVGTYRLTDTITLGDNVELSGHGSQSVLAPVFSPSPPNRVIDNDWVSGNSNIVLRSFKLDRSGANVQHGILLNGVNNLLIDGIEVSGTPSVVSGCIAISGIGPSTDLESKNVRVVNCYFAQSSNFAVQPGYVDGCVIANNVAEDCYREVFSCEPEGAGSTARNVTISGNTCLGSDVIAGSSTGVIVVTATSGGTIQGCSVTGNSIRQISGGATGNVGINVIGINLSNVTVTGNTVSGMDGPGINVGGSGVLTDGVVVSGNSVTDCGGSWLGGISLRSATRTTVTGNYVYGTNHTASITESVAAAKNLIAGNYLRDSTPLTLLYSNGTLAYGNHFDNNVDFKLGGTHSLQANLQFNRNASSSASNSIFFYRDSSLRWSINNSGTESGSNVGSDITFIARTDAGGPLGNALVLKRSDLSATVGGKIVVGSTIELGNASDTTLSRSSAGMVAVEGNPVGVKVAVPANASATGVVGQWAADASWIYVCTATNTWVRAALATW